MRLGGVGFGRASCSSAVGDRESCGDRRVAELACRGSWADGGCDCGTGAAVLGGSRRLLFADVFGLTCWVAEGTGVGFSGSEGKAALAWLAGSGSRCGWFSASGAMTGMVNRSPKSASWTW